MSKGMILIVATIALVSITAAIVAEGTEDTAVSRPSGRRPENVTTMRPPRLRSLSPEQEAELLEMLKAKVPQRYERLVELRESKPQSYRWALRHTWRWYQHLKDLPSDVQDATITEQAQRVNISKLIRELRGTNDRVAKADLENQLREAIRKSFDAEQTLREHKLGELEERIKRLRAELKARLQQRSELIQERVEHWLRAAARPPHQAGPRPTTRPARRPPPGPALRPPPPGPDRRPPPDQGR